MKPYFTVVADVEILPRNILSVLSKYRKCSIVAAYVAWVLSLPFCRASTIIVIVDQGRVLIGADSLWKGSIAGADLRCKIEIVRPTCVFATVGLRTKPETHFNSAALARSACLLGGPLTAITAAFDAATMAPLKRAMNYSRINDPVVYKRDYQGKSPLEAVFAGFRDGKALAVVKSFFLDQQGTLTDKPSVQIPDDAGNNVLLMGHKDAANIFLSRSPNWPSVSYPELINRLIQSEIADKPDYVGGPISILEITETKQTWIQPGKCQ